MLCAPNIAKFSWQAPACQRSMLIDRTRSSAPNAALKRVENVLINQIEVAIEAASSTSLVELNRVIWQGLRAGALSEDDAQRLAEAIHARQALTKTLRKPVGAAGRLVPAFLPDVSNGLLNAPRRLSAAAISLPLASCRRPWPRGSRPLSLPA